MAWTKTGERTNRFTKNIERLWNQGEEEMKEELER